MDSFAKNVLYCEALAYYIWSNNTFERRKKGIDFERYFGMKKDQALGRVYMVPQNTKCYYLRMLLQIIRATNIGVQG